MRRHLAACGLLALQLTACAQQPNAPLTPRQLDEQSARWRAEDAARQQQRFDEDRAAEAQERARLAHEAEIRAEAAKPRPVAERIEDARSCVAQSEATIAREKKIGREVGVVDMAALHNAGASKIACQKRLQVLKACQAKPSTCPPESP